VARILNAGGDQKLATLVLRLACTLALLISF